MISFATCRHPGSKIRVFAPDVAAGDDIGPPTSGADVRGDGAVQIGYDHNVELLGLSDELHGIVGVVNSQIDKYE